MSYEYKNLTPFKWCIIENFPFIEADFDAITNYQLFCKVVEYLNKTIDSTNVLGQKVEEFANYFDNLDVQDEINKKLDELVENGEIERLLNKQYLVLQNDIKSLDNKIKNVASGSPAGVYETIAELQQANPDHTKIYLVEEDGEWYYWNDTTNQWKNGGIYQSMIIAENSVETKNLSETVKNIINAKYPIINIINGYYRNKATITENNAFLYTEPIQLLKGETIEFIGKGYQSNVTILMEVNEQNEYISILKQSTNNDFVRVKYTTPKNCYVSICTASSEGIKDIAIYESVNNIINKEISIPFTHQQGYYINQAGNAVPYINNNYSVTDFIKIAPNIKYLLKNIEWTSSDNAGMGFYDENKKFISYIMNAQASDYDVIPPYNASYVRFTLKTINIGEVIFRIKNLNETITEIQDNIFNYINLSLFEKFGVIGDSYASGELYYNDGYRDIYSISWGQIMARKLGTQCTNYSSGGLSTRSWLTSPRGLTKLKNSAPEDIYYLALGINDYYHLGADYLGNITDISNYDNKDNYLDTFYGNYGKIIENIKEHAPNAKIIMFTTAGTSDLATQFNDAIINIANYYNLPYIEQLKDDFFKSRIYTDMAGGHPTALGYSGMATTFEKMINKCIVSNYNYFRNFKMY